MERLRRLVEEILSKARASRSSSRPDVDIHSIALFHLVAAENEAQVDEAIALEPRMLSREDEQQAYQLAAILHHVGKTDMAAIFLQGAHRIAELLERLVRPEENPLVRLAEEVHNGVMTLDEARSRVEQGRLFGRVRLAHLAALDDYVVHLRQKGNLTQAERLATLNYVAARRTGHAKVHADTALSLATIKSAVGKYEEAIPLLEEAARLAEQIGDRKRLVWAIGPLGTAYQKVGKHERAREYYERALALARDLDARNLEVAALGNLALLYLGRGNLQDADALSAQALELAHEAAEDGLDPEHTYQLAQALGTRAAVLHLSGRLEQAVDLYRESVRLSQRLGDIPGALEKRVHLGLALAALGEYDQALHELEDVNDMAARLPIPPVKAKALTLLGAVYLRRGEPTRALEALEQALAVKSGLTPAEQAFCWLGLVDIRFYLNQLSFAEQAIQQAADLASSSANPRLETIVHLYRAHLAAQREQWPDVETWASQALAQARRLRHLDLELTALSLLGRACQAQERWEDAEIWYRQVLERAQAAGHRLTAAQAQLHLGMVQAARRRFEEAERMLTAALKSLEGLGRSSFLHYIHYHLGRSYAEHPNDLPRAMDHFRTALALLEEEREEMGQIEVLEQAYGASRQHIYRAAAETALRLGQPLEALGILEQNRARILTRRMVQGEALPPTLPENLKVRYIHALQAVQTLQSHVYGEPGWGGRLAEEVQLGIEALGLAKTEAEIVALVAQTRARTEQQRRLALSRARAELESVVRAIQEHAPGFKIRTELPPLDWGEIVSDPHTAVVALFSGRQTAAAVLFHPSGVRTVDLPALGWEEVERLLYGLPDPLAEARREIRRRMDQAPLEAGVAASLLHYLVLREMMSGDGVSHIGWQVALSTLVSEASRAVERERLDEWLDRWNITVPHLREEGPFDLAIHDVLSLWEQVLNHIAEGLWERLWAPLLPLLRERGVTQVVVVPDGELHAVPLALGLTKVNAPLAVAFAPSLWFYAHTLRRLRAQAPHEGALLAVANPTGDLPAAEVEATLLYRFCTAHGRTASTLMGGEATLENVVKALEHRPTYWHFAGHARFMWWDPAASALYLARAERLSFLAIPATLDLRGVRLAVLSACETGVAPVRDPVHEFEGLFSAFLMAGASAVLASLWPVEELATALLMHRFYQYHLGDPQEGLAPRAPAEALRDAQAWLRTLTVEEVQRHPVVRVGRELYPTRDSRFWQQMLALEGRGHHPFRNPYFWAGFVLAGV